MNNDPDKKSKVLILDAIGESEMQDMPTKAVLMAGSNTGKSAIIASNLLMSTCSTDSPQIIDNPFEAPPIAYTLQPSGNIEPNIMLSGQKKKRKGNNAKRKNKRK